MAEQADYFEKCGFKTWTVDKMGWRFMLWKDEFGNTFPQCFAPISGNLEMLGMVKGSTIQCKNIGRDIGASFKNLVGGEMKAYTEMMNEARDLAIQRMVEEAEGLGADAVVNIRFATSAIIQGAAEVIAYGTAVKFVNK